MGGVGAARGGLHELMVSKACFAVGRSAGSVAKHKSINCSISAGHSSGTCMCSKCAELHRYQRRRKRQHDTLDWGLQSKSSGQTADF